MWLYYKIIGRYFLYFVVLSILWLTGCSKSPKCWGDNKIKGIIVESVRIDCPPLTGESDFVIVSDSVYQNTFIDLLSSVYPCGGVPEIDFNAYTLLGHYTTGQCEVKYIREVEKFDNLKKYHYKVVVKSCGTCKSEAYSYNWVTVPKLPDGWTVTFETEND